MPEFKKRETAHKLRVGDILRGNQIFDETPPENPEQTTNKRLLHIEIGDKKVQRINIVANVVDKFESEGESKFASITVDDGSGQIKGRVFGEDLVKFQDLTQGDTLIIIGFLRSFNQELYVLPEIVRKQDPKYLLVRKLEIDKSSPPPTTTEQKQEVKAYRDEVIDMIKNAEQDEQEPGIDKETIIMKFTDAKPDVITQEIQKLLEEGIIYEPKPGRVRYLG
jgi:RPA family protein